jgi:hypothetical protein
VDGFYGTILPISVAVLDNDQPAKVEVVTFRIWDGRYHAPGVPS